MVWTFSAVILKAMHPSLLPTQPTTDGKRCRGRPNTRWKDILKRLIKPRGLCLGNARMTALNLADWRRVIAAGWVCEWVIYTLSCYDTSLLTQIWYFPKMAKIWYFPPNCLIQQSLPVAFAKLLWDKIGLCGQNTAGYAWFIKTWFWKSV